MARQQQVVDTEAKSALDKEIERVNKEYGKGSVISSSLGGWEGDVISTGSLKLDLATGVGGYARGKVHEIIGWESSGKSTIILHMIADAQRKGLKCLLVDGENSFDSVYATTLGVDVDSLLINQLDEMGAEKCYNIAERLIRTKELGLVAFDSQTSLLPKKYYDTELGESKIGLTARMMGEAVPKILNAAAYGNTCAVFVSQVREKIGVMFGCLHADMPILFADGRTIPIRKVVEEKIEGNVYCYNEETEKIESKPIIDWHYNGNVQDYSDFIHIETESIDGGGKFGITVTPNHKVLTSKGWIEAKDICEGDRVASKYESILKGVDSENFIKGCLVGDSHISIRDRNTGSLKFQDCQNPEYAKWKVDILSSVLKFNQNGVRWESEYTYELAMLKKEAKNRNPVEIFKERKISNLSLAIWMMDDGYYKKSHKNYVLSVKRFKDNREVLEKIKEIFENSELKCSYNKEGEFYFTVEASMNIAQRIATFVPTCMKYKLPDTYRDLDFYVAPLIQKEMKIGYVNVLSKRFASDRQLRQKGKYDISVMGNHNYFSGGARNGVIVHNSPETTSGGNALRFYAHTRTEMRKTVLKDKDGGEAFANKTRCKIIKNKLAVPFKEADFRINFGKGVDRVDELFDLAVTYDIIQKSGSWYSANGTQIGQGEDAVIKLLEDNPEMVVALEKKVLQKIKPEEDARSENVPSGT